MNTKKLFIYALTLGLGIVTYSCASSGEQSSTERDLTQRVNPFIGTDWVGNVYPGAASPFGMVQLSPDNGLSGWDRIAGYYYPDSTIAGFSHTHLSGTGAGDLYDISFLPVLLPALDTASYSSPEEIAKMPVDERPNLGVHALFDHDSERASAGYYRVMLRPYDIEVELTTTPHIGVQQYTFHQASDSACVILNLRKAMNWDRTVESGLEQIDATTLSGYRHSDGWARNQQLYFYTKLSKAPERITIDSLKNADGKTSVVAKLYYKVAKGDQLLVQTALSGVSREGAKKNWQAESAPATFEAFLKANQERWNAYLGRVELTQEANPDLMTTFYTALYRTALCPTLYSDVDGAYLGADRQIHQTSQGTKHYETFSLWDTYRSAHPLYNIIAPEANRDFVQSLIDFGEQNQGHLPVWNMFASETDMMIGYHSVPVIVEAILKGVYKPQSPQKLASLLRSTAERRDYRGLDSYRERGYIHAQEQEESVSKTLEYAYDDSAISAYLQSIGDQEGAKEYAKRAKNYTHLWDAGSGFFRPRLSDGSWKTPFDPFAYTKDYTESNAYHYLMSVQQDVDGLTALMGGEQGLAKRLDEYFGTETPSHITLPIFSTGMIGQYAHGNEPGHHVLFLYNKAKQPWKTQRLSRQICQTLYTNTPKGLCGNEDCGQMSAWYVFASLGFYPVNPLDGRYELTTPLFKEVRLPLSSGKTFSILAKGLTDQAIYIKSVKVDGKPYAKSYITYEQILSGATIELEMTTEEGHCWY